MDGAAGATTGCALCADDAVELGCVGRSQATTTNAISDASDGRFDRARVFGVIGWISFV
jgi:hypothetical protein